MTGAAMNPRKAIQMAKVALDLSRETASCRIVSGDGCAGWLAYAAC